MRIILLSCTLLLFAQPATAQRAGDNAVTAAEDAFGVTLGNESIGIYSARRVRGFSPVEAGNVRLEGLYLDRQGALPPPLVEGSAIRVGLSAQGYPFPAPTGIVDYRLRKPGEERVISVISAWGPYAGRALEVNAKLPLVTDKLGVSAAISHSQEEYYDGADADYVRAGLVTRWRPTETIEITPFWSLSRGRDEEAPPSIRTRGAFLPPRLERRRLMGPSWADNETESVNYGVIAKARLGHDWAFALGAFSSRYERSSGYSNVFADTTAEGTARHWLIADPEQRYASTSGELRASRSFTEGPRLHLLHAIVRSRHLQSIYGGSARPLDLGLRQLTMPASFAPAPPFVFGERTRDVVQQSSVGISYESRWREVGSASLGLLRTRYEKRVDQPGLDRTATHDEPWLVNAALSAHLSPQVALYAGHTRGLEESGIAPADVANRNEALPAIRTQQSEAGLRWAISPSMKLVAGLFDVRKPYFTTNDSDVYTTLGEVQHRGLELSLSGKPAESLSLVVGAVLMRPRVTGAAVESGSIGNKPVGQSDHLLRADIDYRLPFAPSWSVDLSTTYSGARTASRDGKNRVPAYAVLDIGARYRFQIGPAKSTLRLQVANVSDTYVWNIYGSNSFGLSDERRFLAQLAIDFPE
ncbi:MAG: TonB-dependent receptor [Rhodanobacteraceae bacterium]|nr:TonB-dependent receptor [Rhodanobacteraceae bacterium]